MAKRASQLDRFFKELAGRWKKPVRIILTGAWAVVAWGTPRASHDVDFEVDHLAPRDAPAFDAAARAAGEAAGLAVQYSTDIDRWSSIVLLDYRRKTQPLKRVGAIDVRVLDQQHWSIGKIARYVDTDVQDLVEVFRRVKPDPVQLATFWRRAIARSPLSTQQWPTKRQALDFFRRHGRTVWGRTLPLEHIERILA